MLIEYASQIFRILFLVPRLNLSSDIFYVDILGVILSLPVIPLVLGLVILVESRDSLLSFDSPVLISFDSFLQIII